MTKVDFYILQSDTNEKQLHFVCRLLEKAVRQGNRILVHTHSSSMSSQLDELLWSYKAESYLPHAVISSKKDEVSEPIALTHDTDSPHHNDLFVNVSLQLPSTFSRFKRFAQVVNQTDASLTASRQHFAFLKDRGYPINVNKLSF